MKLKMTFLFSFFFCSSLFAQDLYKIDLRNSKKAEYQYLQMGNTGPKGKEIRVNNQYMEIGGVPVLPVMGEFHYNRCNPKYWRDHLMKMKSSGVNIVSTYVLWSLHEEFEGHQDWTGHNNLHQFVALCKELGLLVHLRIGPYCNAEILSGGLPTWLTKDRRFATRSNDPLYLNYVHRWYQSVYNQVKDFLYKDNGPIMAIQLENEYVKSGLVKSHLMNLKKMAVEIGFDVPLYTMTHWMSTEYPEGEIIPYAGYYIETPWTTSGKEEIKPSDFEYFTYKRISNNIGNDIIGKDFFVSENGHESLTGELSKSPYFTCEIGVGTTCFVHRRAVVPEEMAGENITLRLGSGVNLMGYYMYSGGTNPVGESSVFGSEPRLNYDYQAPIGANGTLGAVMKETKKFNYFMNDFGTALAPATAYLPSSNNNTSNLQWAVRMNNGSGFLFCSNTLYKNKRPNFEGVQFSVDLDGETITLPSKKVTVSDQTYFIWPFNQPLNGVLLKYSTTQPICSHTAKGVTSYFFFEDDSIPGEYLIDASNIASISVNNGTYRKEKNRFFISQLKAGENCVIRIKQKNKQEIRLVTLTEKQSDMLWKGRFKGEDFVALTPSALVYDDQHMTIMDNASDQNIRLYGPTGFTNRPFRRTRATLQPIMKKVGVMANASCIKPNQGDHVYRNFRLITHAPVEKAYLRCYSTASFTAVVNGEPAQFTSLGKYVRAEIGKLIKNGENSFDLTLSEPSAGVTAVVEVLLKNGQRLMWTTDNTWNDSNKKPVSVIENSSIRDLDYNENLAVYEISIPSIQNNEEEVRLYIDYRGDTANAYIGNDLVDDAYFNGLPWIFGLSRMSDKLDTTPLTIVINGFKNKDANVYLEKWLNIEECVHPFIKQLDIRKEYRYQVK